MDNFGAFVHVNVRTWRMKFWAPKIKLNMLCCPHYRSCEARGRLTLVTCVARDGRIQGQGLTVSTRS